MARSQGPTPFYIRTAFGDTYHVDTLEEALRDFTAPHGYRLTLMVDGLEVIIRRASTTHDEQGAHDLLGEDAYKATVVVRDQNKKP